jgi:hypothetical protein
MPDQLHKVVVTQSDESIPEVLDGYAKSAFCFSVDGPHAGKGGEGLS